MGEKFYHVKVGLLIKKGPGKGRHRSYWCIKSDRHKARSELLPFKVVDLETGKTLLRYSRLWGGPPVVEGSL